jgi:hypothetical protein
MDALPVAESWRPDAAAPPATSRSARRACAWRPRA